MTASKTDFTRRLDRALASRRVHDAQRRLLRDVAGVDVAEMAESSVC